MRKNITLDSEPHQKRHSPPKAFQLNIEGATLISLMIGMLISIISGLAMLALYKNLVHTSVSATADASHDGQVSIALATIQLELQNAGYGILNAGAEHLSTSTDGTQIRWRFLDNNKYQCRSIQEDATTPNSRSITLFEATKNCTEDSALKDLTWKPITTLAKITRESKIDNPIFNFSVSVATCAPFNIGENEKHLIASISATGSADFHDLSNNISSTQFHICLASTHPA